MEIGEIVEIYVAQGFLLTHVFILGTLPNFFTGAKTIFFWGGAKFSTKFSICGSIFYSEKDYVKPKTVQLIIDYRTVSTPNLAGFG